jgi:putative DNA primase/helicase
MSNRDGALEWASKGCAVFPLWWRLADGKCACNLPLCDQAGKHPKIAKGFHAATTERKKIKEWWKRWPEANIGLATGKRSKLIVLDVDEEAGVRSIEQAENHIPETYTVVTQRGGLHLYFEAPDFEVRSRIRFMPGLDLRGDGGYVVAPPSPGYEVAEDIDPAPFDWLHKLLRRSVFARVARSKGPLVIPKKIAEGERHKVLFKVACRLRGAGEDEEGIKKLLHELNEERCEPPEDSRIIDYLVEDVCSRYAPGPEKGTDRYDELGLVERIRLELSAPEADSISTREEHWFYDGGIWTALGDDGVAAFLHSWKDEVYRTVDDKIRTFRPTRTRIMNVSGHLRLVARKDGFFDDRPRVLAFKNGVVLPDGSMAAHSPAHRLLFMRQEEYDPCAECEVWEAFLDCTFAGPDREEKKAVFQEFAGAALFGAAPKYEKALMLVGPGANGKSVILKVMEGIMPSGSVTAVVPHDMQQEYRRAALANSLLNIVSEVPARELRESEAVKAIISGDVIEGRPIRKEEFTFRPCAAHLFAANMLPDITDFTLGFRRRWIILTCPNTVPDGEQIPDLGGKMLDLELQGILRWAVDGMVRLARRGAYTGCRSSDHEVISWLRASDPIADFVEECCVLDGGLFTARLEVYHKFVLWTSTTGRRRIARRKFLPRLRSYVDPAVHKGERGFRCRVDRIF